MHEGRTRNVRLRRLLGVAGGVWLLAFAAAPTALADAGLAELTSPQAAVTDVSGADGDPTSPGAAIEETAGSLTDAAASVPQVLHLPLPEASAPTLAQATESVPQAQATESVEQATATLTQSAAPVEATLETTKQQLQTVTAELAAAESIAQPLLQETMPALDPVLETANLGLTALDKTVASVTGADVAGPILGVSQRVAEAATESAAAVSTEALSPPASHDDRSLTVAQQPGVAFTAPASPTALPAATSTRHRELPAPARDTVSRASPSEVPRGVLPASGYAFARDTESAIVSTPGGTKASSLSPSVPAPFAPGGPVSAFASASASAGGGALALLLAALAAALVLVVPGLGRRLRPRLAPWPRPILQLSLERPG